ncbi:MAG: 8-oxoguanine DNA glycosylase [Lachnospiraceae bacterium]|nr:8-oxoguanine DNA glycosylase [Lachnospiraceae bacterium]
MYELSIENFDLDQIAQSGQIFRWKAIDPKGYETAYEIPAFNKRLRIYQSGRDLAVSCSEKEWMSIWYSYFDMGTDYNSVLDKIHKTKDEFLISASEQGSGIRILRQDLWEMIITFMISQNNNIPRIRNSVEKICQRCNKNGDFPKSGEIDVRIFDDASLGLGYRAPYLKEMCKYAKAHPHFTDELKDMSYAEAFDTLLNFRGIGKKVAGCICLFGLHHIDAFPIDTHIKKVLDTYYPHGFDPKPYEGFAGIVQQYMFYADYKK